MCILAQVIYPVRLALLVLVYHMVKTLVVVQVRVAGGEIKDTVWNSGEEFMCGDIGYLIARWSDVGLGHLSLCVMVMLRKGAVAL